VDLPIPAGALDDRVRALEKIQTDQTLVLGSLAERIKKLEEFVQVATQMAEKIKGKGGGFLSQFFGD